jgi:hypothetical protein
MMFQGLNSREAETHWQSFLTRVAKELPQVQWRQAFHVAAVPAHYLWDPDFLKKYAPDMIGSDPRPGVSSRRIFWKGDAAETGQWLFGYHSQWLSEDLLAEERIQEIAEKLAFASNHWTVSLHFNKGLAGADEIVKQEALQTAVHPSVINAFALAIIAGGEQPKEPGQRPDPEKAKKASIAMQEAYEALQRLDPAGGSYLSEGDFFEKGWQQRFWGIENYKRLSKVKWTYDPDGLFFVHHGVGSEDWSEDGFTRKF